MRTNRIAGVVLLAALLTAGCGGFFSMKNPPVGPSFATSKPTEQRSDAALVYVMRTKAEPRHAPATLLVDGGEVAAISQWGFTWFYVKPGTHTLGVQWDQVTGQHPAQSTVELAAGKAYYFEVQGVSQSTGHGDIRRSSLLQHPGFEVPEKLTACGYQKARTEEPVP